MSFDLVSICNGLQSTKVRDRNDATNVLEELVTSGLGSLSLKNLALLVSLALQLIQHEKVLYLKASSNSAVESRISKASSCISSLVENSFKRGNNQKNALRYKHIIAILFDIVGVVQVDSSTLFWPCAFDLIRVFNLALQQDFVKDHLGTLDWLLVYRFLIQCIETIQEDNNPNNLALLVEVFTCVCNLIQANESISILYLQIMGPYRRASSAASSGRRRSSVLSPSETSYFRLLPILTKATKLMQREGALTVVLLKIINKLIITLGTEDILFVNKMILLGISILIRYNNSKLSSLQTQMFIFLNLDGVHDYLVLTELPKMNKKPDSADISIRSEEELEDDAESADNELIKYGEEFDDQLEVDNKVLVYDIGVLIQSFFNISLQASFQIPRKT